MCKWKKIKLKEVLTEISERNKNENIKKVLSVTNSQGFIVQEDYFEGTVHSENISNYKIIRKKQFAYNPSRVNVGSIDILEEYEYGVLSPMYIVFEVDKTKLLPEYFKYYFQTHEFFENVKNNTQGSVRHSLSFKALANFEYLLPTIEEQEKIVKLLKNLDCIINKYEKLLEEKNQFIKSQFVEMFGNLEINNKKWKIVNILEVASIDTNMTKDFEKYAKSPHIGIENIEKNTGQLINYISVEESNLTSGKYIFDERHIIYSKIRPNLNKVATPDFKGLCSADSYPILTNEKCNKEYLVFVLRSDYFLNYILSYSSRTNIPKVNKEQLSRFGFPLPPIELQNQFADIVKQIDKQQIMLEQQKKNYEKLKKGLMQQLLTGKVRVKI